MIEALIKICLLIMLVSVTILVVGVTIMIIKDYIDNVIRIILLLVILFCVIGLLLKPVSAGNYIEEVTYNNTLCDYGRGASYTHYNGQNWNYDYLNAGDNTLYADDIYMDDNGYYKEKETDAYLVAMGTYYNYGYYYIEIANEELSTYNGHNYNIIVKTFDVKSDSHTDSNNCYTTSDNSIIEFQVHSEYVQWEEIIVEGIYSIEYNGEWFEHTY